MKFGIKNKSTNELFAGFDKKQNPIWTNDKTAAWSRDKLTAKCQAVALIKFGAQQKPVAL